MRVLLLLLLALPLEAAQPKAARVPTVGRFEGTRPLTIVHGAAEGAPYAKTGGLGDVIQDLPRELARLGHDVIRVQPKVSNIPAEHLAGFKPEGEIEVRVDNTPERVALWTKTVGGVKHVLLDHRHFDNPGPYYGGDEAMEERFMVLQRAILEAPGALGRRPDIVGLHDWHVAPAAAMLKMADAPAPMRAAKSVLTVHNIAFQGQYPLLSALKAGFPSKLLTWDNLSHHGGFNFLKAGLQYADALTTVSVNHARELLRDGHGLEGVLRHRSERLTGIPNGLDEHLWSPQVGTSIAHRYDPQTVYAGKAANKAALQREARLNVDPGLPMFAIVSRLTHAKGIDLAARGAEEALSRGAQLAVMGTGEDAMVEAVKQLALRFPGQVFFHHGFGDPRRIFAAADFLLMPSRIEPGGLSNQQAQQYGALPIVGPVGGLLDSTSHGVDGFILRALTPEAVAEAMAWAMALHEDLGTLHAARRAAMTRDKSWKKPLAAYERLYYGLVGLPVPR